MANLKEIRTRISSVSSTMKITSAMKMVSAAKLKKAQDNIEKLRPYAEKLNNLILDLSDGINDELGPLVEERSSKKVLFVMFSSNRGLCGGFNASLVKYLDSISKENYRNFEKSIFCIGKKGLEPLKRKNLNVVQTDIELLNEPSFLEVSKIANDVTNQFLEKKYDKIVLIFNKFKNAASQIPYHEQLLPISSPAESKKNNTTDYIFEPDNKQIIQNILPKSVKIMIFKSLLESIASEQGARMTAMHKATDNAGELKKELTLSYNKARQAAITGEILEIVGGAEALNG